MQIEFTILRSRDGLEEGICHETYNDKVKAAIAVCRLGERRIR